MSESTEACIRGCSLYSQHLTDCEDRDNCRGCLPRRADHGHLCWPCHRRFELMLTDAPVVYRWLTGNLATGQGGAATDEPHVTSSKELPLPIKAAVYDVRQLLADRLALTTDHIAELLSVQAPRHGAAADAKFMLTWLSSIERLEFVGDWWEELAETMIDAHALAPWRPAMKRVPRVSCPRCKETNLAIYGGESDITCLSCRGVMTEDQFDMWQEVLRQDQEATA